MLRYFIQPQILKITTKNILINTKTNKSIKTKYQYMELFDIKLANFLFKKLIYLVMHNSNDEPHTISLISSL